jgi:hypothetical protein
VKYHKGKTVNFQTHHRVVVLIPSHRVRGTIKSTLAASGTGAAGCGGTYITRVRVLGVYHWMYTSHAVSSWGWSSVTTFCSAVAQPSMYGCTL